MDNLDKIKERLKALVAKNDLEAVILEINQIIKHFPLLDNDWTVLQSRINKFIKHELIFGIAPEKSTFQYSSIVAGILNLVDRMELKIPERPSKFLQPNQAPISKRSRKSPNARPIRIYCSITDDLIDEKNMILEVLDEVSHNFSQSEAAEITFYTNLEPSEIPVSPSDADLYLLVLWWDYGQSEPSENADRGINLELSHAWEYEQALIAARQRKDYRQLMIYRCERPIMRPGEKEFETKFNKFKLVDQLFEKISQDGLTEICYFEDVQSFGAVLFNALMINCKTVLNRGEGEKPLIEQTKDERYSEEELNETRVLYLNWLIEQHAELVLRGLGDSGMPKIPLEKVYVALKGYRTGNFELEQSEKLHHAEMAKLIKRHGAEINAIEFAAMMRHAELLAVRNNPITPSLQEIHREITGNDSHTGNTSRMETITLADAFKREQRLVILGDPGSGKTTLARWLVLKLARAFLEDQPTVKVPRFQVDPEMVEDNEQLVELGQVRLPVLIRVSEFAEAYFQARKNVETLSIVDFMGRHSWLGQSSGIDPKLLNQLFRQEMNLGNALIILDGMDEITVDSQREEIVRSIESLIQQWVSIGLRNQLIVTSRIAGYQRKPLTGDISHVIIKPMGETAVRHFCDAWTLAVQQQTNTELTDAANRQIAREKAEALKREIYSNNRLGIRDLATNPLMVTILALVYRKSEGFLPEQRSQLYELAMNILIKEWRVTGMKPEEIEYALAPLAAHIHENYATGLIDESELREIVSEELARYRGMSAENAPPKFIEEVNNFIFKVKQDVGLLTERSAQMYGFLHLTFQEYLAALHLIRDRKSASETIVEKLNDPRWREPILLALGHISNKWGPKSRKALLSELLHADNALSNILPQSALLIASAIKEMVQIPDIIIEEICQRLLISIAKQEQIGYSYLVTQIEKGLQIIYDSDKQVVLEQVFKRALLNCPDNPKIASSVARIISANRWFHTSESIFQSLVLAMQFDEKREGYPFQKAVKSLCAVDFSQFNFNSNNDAYEEIEPDGQSADILVPMKTLPQLADIERILPMRHALMNDSDLLDFVNRTPEWQMLITLLYGGVSDRGLGTVCQQYYEIAGVLQVDKNRDIYFEQIKRRPYWQKNWNENTDWQTFLEDLLQNQYRPSVKACPGIEISIDPQYIFEDSKLTPLILSCLKNRQSPGLLVSELRPALENATSTDMPALLSAVLLEPSEFFPILETAIRNTPELADKIQEFLSRRHADLKGVIQLIAEKNQFWKGLDNYSPDDGSLAGFVEFFVKVICESGIVPSIPEFTDLPDKQKAYFESEKWASYFSGYGDYNQYKFTTQVLDAPKGKNDALSAFSLIHRSHVRQMDWFSKWRLETVPPNYSSLPIEELYTDLCSCLIASDFTQMDALSSIGLLFCHNYEKEVQEDGLLADDLLACTLFLPRNHQFEVWNKIRTKTDWLSEAALFSQLYRSAPEIKDPAKKARLLWRISKYCKFFQQDNTEIFFKALRAAKQIKDAFSRFRAVERLLEIASPVQFPKLFDLAIQFLEQVRDPDNRARGFARLSKFVVNPEGKEILIKETLNSAVKIKDESARVDAFIDIAPIFGTDKNYGLYFERTLKSIKNPQEKNRLQNLHVFNLLENGRFGPDWPALLVSGFCSELSRYFSREATVESPVKKMLSEDYEAAVQELLQMVSENPDSGLLLNQETIEVIDKLLEDGTISRMYKVLPYLFSLRLNHLPTLERWLASGDLQLEQYAALMLAEHGQLSPEIIDKIGVILSTGMDVGRFRVCLALHGPSPTINNPYSRFRTSYLGTDTLLALSRLQLSYKSTHQGKYNILGWAWLNVLFDSNDVLNELLEEVEADRQPGRDLAAHIIGRISAINQSAAPAFYGAFTKSSLLLKEQVLASINRIGYVNKDLGLPRVTEISHVEAMEKWYPEIKEITRSIPDRQQTIYQVIQQTLSKNKAKVSEMHILAQQAQDAIFEQTVTGEHDSVVYWVGTDAMRSDLVAEQIVISIEQIELLIAWSQYTQLNPQETHWHEFLRATLLEIGAACANHAPATLINLLTKYQMSGLLFHAAQNEKWYFGRASAIKLIAFLELVPANLAELLQHAFEDVADVQDAAIWMAQTIRYIDQSFVTQLLTLLKSTDASLVYAAIRMLSLIGRNERTSKTNRQMIIATCSELLQQPGSKRSIYIVSPQSNDKSLNRIRNIGRIDKAASQAIVEISGMY